MPSHAPLPTIADLVAAGHNGIRGLRIATGDDSDGSKYDLLVGTSAVLWARQAQRDRDAFRSVYDETAIGSDLSNRLLQKTGIARTYDSFGTGQAIFQRATAAAGGGTFLTGTRIQIPGGAQGPAYYAVNSAAPGTVVPANATTAIVPIRATTYGTGVAIDTTLGGPSGSLADTLWDNTWQLQSIVCGNGTTYEKAKDYLARVRQTQVTQRVGFELSIIAACEAAGASNVAVFPSSYAGNDYGISAVYVGDSNYVGSAALVNACIVALEAWRVLGPELHVGAMVTSPLLIDATVALSVDPSTVDQVTLVQSLQNAAYSQFSQSGNGFAYSRSAITGAMQRAQPLVQAATYASPTVDATVMVGTSPPLFPQMLTRYTLTPPEVAITLVGPS